LCNAELLSGFKRLISVNDGSFSGAERAKRLSMSANEEEILKVSGLNVKLQNQPILDNISFTVRKGTTLAVLGPNGAGKSVLFKVLLNLLPHEGTVEWCEKAKIGYVPQNVTVSDIPISVREFLSIGKSQCDLKAALSLVKLNDAKILDKRLGILSGGQLRRVLIAWALIDDPNILLLDEPTTGVDVGSEEPIFLMLDGIKKAKKMTILLITHDIHIVQEYADYLLALNHCVTFFGKSQQIGNIETQKAIYGEPICVETLRTGE
jgi:zinc transport system ATP-binding protein